jgi:hypothetical protein
MPTFFLAFVYFLYVMLLWLGLATLEQSPLDRSSVDYERRRTTFDQLTPRNGAHVHKDRSASLFENNGGVFVALYP